MMRNPRCPCRWRNAGRLTIFQQRAAAWAVYLATCALIVFFMIPVTFVQSLATLSNLAKLACRGPAAAAHFSATPPRQLRHSRAYYSVNALDPA